MKFQPDTLAGTNAISAHDAGIVWVNGQRFEGSLLVPWKGAVTAWQAGGFDALDAQHFDAVLALQPELVIFGSGARLRFVSPSLYRGLIAARVGIETMDTSAACRTYNVLASEGRSVVAALLPTTNG
jgi:uncharacterized protein